MWLTSSRILVPTEPVGFYLELRPTFYTDLMAWTLERDSFYKDIRIFGDFDFFITDYFAKGRKISCHCYSCYIMIWLKLTFLLGKLPETIQIWDSVPECSPDAGRCSRKLWWEGRVSILSRESIHPPKLLLHLGNCASYFSCFCLVIWDHSVLCMHATICSTPHNQPKSPTFSFLNLLYLFTPLYIWISWSCMKWSFCLSKLNCSKLLFFFFLRLFKSLTKVKDFLNPSRPIFSKHILS